MSSILAGFKISTPAPFQSPALSSLGMMSQPYMCGAFLTPSESYAEDIAPSLRPLDSIMAERIITSREFSPPFDRRSVMSKEWGISILSASPIFSPFRNMSANVSIPPNFNTARSPHFSSGLGNLREYIHWYPSYSRSL